MYSGGFSNRTSSQKNYHSSPNGLCEKHEIPEKLSSHHVASNSQKNLKTDDYLSPDSRGLTIRKSNREAHDMVDSHNLLIENQGDLSKSPNLQYRDSFPPDVDDVDEDIPYHARQTSKPFSYGATSDMIKNQKLSPTPERKTLLINSTPSVASDKIPREDIGKPFASLKPIKNIPPQKSIDESWKVNSANINSPSWLEQQQLKLAARKDGEDFEVSRNLMSRGRMLDELKDVQKSFSHNDGPARVFKTSIGENSHIIDSSQSPKPSKDNQNVTREIPIPVRLERKSENQESFRNPDVNNFRSTDDRQFNNSTSPSSTERSSSPGSRSSKGLPRSATPANQICTYTNNNDDFSESDYAIGINKESRRPGYNSDNDCMESSSGYSYISRIMLSRECVETWRGTGLPPKSPSSWRTRERERIRNGQNSIDCERKYIGFIQNSQLPASYNHEDNINHSSPSMQSYTQSRSSNHSYTVSQEVSDANIQFVRDSSKIWYKPNISRDEAISMLKDEEPGTFVVRDSTSYPGAFGLALKVASYPPGVVCHSRDASRELVRHFLIEPTLGGVRLKGCPKEPVFSSLSALVYQHSLTAMALPCPLLLPGTNSVPIDSPRLDRIEQVLARGAACNVFYLFTLDTESLTGPQAVEKTVTTLFSQKPLTAATIVHFKVSIQGITLTDRARELFFRRHYPTNNISYCGLDPDERIWSSGSEREESGPNTHRCFGFVARKAAHKSENQCHVFADLEPDQPAVAIVNFVNKVIMSNAKTRGNIVRENSDSG